jgi:thiosulfate dehydrogenase (quinone) large subunit
MAATAERIPFPREVTKPTVDTDRELRLSLMTLLGRLGVGVPLLFFGVGKFIMGYPNFIGYITGMYKDSWLPSFAWLPFAYTIPVAEVGLGIALILGLFTRWTLVLTGLYLVGLMFGQVVLMKPEASQVLLYLILVTGAVWASEADRFSLDALLKIGSPVKAVK